MDKAVFFVTTVVLPLGEDYGERVGEGAGRTKNISAHMAFAHAYDIMKAIGLTKTDLDHSNHLKTVENPPPLVFMGMVRNEDVKKKMSAAEFKWKTPRPLVMAEDIFRPETHGYFMHVKESTLSIAEQFGCAIPTVRETDPTSLLRVRDFFHVLTKSFSGEIPVITEELTHANFSAWKRGTLTFELPPPFPVIVGRAEARGVKEVMLLCAMHAELQIDAIGYPMYSDRSMQFEHAMAARAAGRNAPFPTSDDLPYIPRESTPIPPLELQFLYFIEFPWNSTFGGGGLVPGVTLAGGGISWNLQ